MVNQTKAPVAPSNGTTQTTHESTDDENETESTAESDRVYKRGLASFEDRTTDGITLDGTGEGPVWGDRYGCPYCDFEDRHEAIIRTHITYEDTGKHANRNGFLDAVHVHVLDDDGQTVCDLESPRSTGEIINDGIEPGEIDPALIPEGVREGTKSERILFEAITNPGISTSALAKRVASARGDDPDDVSKSDVSYASGVISNYLSTPDESDTSDGSDSIDRRRMNHRGFYDLTEKQRRVVLSKVADPSPTRSIADIHRGAGEEDMSYPTVRHTLSNYGSIIDHLNAKIEAGSISMDALVESADVNIEHLNLPMIYRRWSKGVRERARSGSFPHYVNSDEGTGVAPLPEAAGVPEAVSLPPDMQDQDPDSDSDQASDSSPTVDLGFVLNYGRKNAKNSKTYDDDIVIDPDDINVQGTIDEFEDSTGKRQATMIAMIATQLDPSKDFVGNDIAQTADVTPSYVTVTKRDHMTFLKRLTVLVVADAVTLRDLESLATFKPDHNPDFDLVDMDLPTVTDPSILTSDQDQTPAPVGGGPSPDRVDDQTETSETSLVSDSDSVSEGTVRVAVADLQKLGMQIDTIRESARDDMELADEGSTMWVAAKKELKATEPTARFLRNTAKANGIDRAPAIADAEPTGQTAATDGGEVDE